MSNLLEKASIVTTPTAYDNGKILSVKPSIVLGSELVTNGDFATDSNWVKGTGWTISGGVATANNVPNLQRLQQGLGTSIIGSKYKYSINISNVSGFYSVYIFGVYVIATSNTEGIIEGEFTATSTNGAFWVAGASAGGLISATIDNVSVKEVIDGDFDFTRNSSATRVNAQGLVEDVQILSSNLVSNGDFSQEGSELVTNGAFDDGLNGWSAHAGSTLELENGMAKVTTVGAQGFIKRSDLSIETGKTYFCKAHITNALYPQWYINGVSNLLNLSLISENTYGAYVTTTGNNPFFYIRGNNTDGEVSYIDNVSVKEVGQDWDLLNDVTSFSFENGIANIQGTANSANNGIKQASIPAVIGKTYKISATLRSNDGGLYRFRLLDGSYFDLGNGNSSEFETITSYHTATSTVFSVFVTSWFTSGTANFDITNISVIEITDDTNLPRIDYTDGVGSWLFEPHSTNLITYSEDFSNSFYVKDSGVSVGTTNNLSPSINANATKIDVTNNGRIYANIATNTYYTTVFIKSGTFSHFKFAGSNVDLIAETNSNGTIQSFGNGWYRIGKSYTGNRPFQIQAYPDGTYSSHTTSGNYFIWGAQSEVQSFATSYIPTNGEVGGVTRLADAAFGAGSSDLINSTEGVLYAEASRFDNDTLFTAISINQNGDFTNSVSIRFRSTENLIFGLIYSDGNISTVMQYTLSDDTQFNKIAISYAENNFSLWVNGIKVLTDTSGNTPIGLNNLSFNSGESENFYGKTKCVAVFKEALTDAELTCLTTI